MSSEKNVFDKFTELMDQNIKGVQYGVYSLAGIGLIVALRSVRPFTKFCKPSNIPQGFLNKHMKFNGKVIRISGGTNPTLIVDHFPLVSLPGLSSRCEGLPVQISSVDVTGNGGIWLGSILRGSKISFIPLRTEEKAVHCIVYNDKNKNVGQHLVSIGFASVGGWDFSLDKDPVYKSYYKALLDAEKLAERKGAGMWLNQQSGGLLNIVNRIRNFRVTFS